MFERNWNISSYDEVLITKLSKSLNVSHVLAKLLIKRNYLSTESATAFLKNNIESFYSPFLMKDVEKGAKTLIDSINKNERILIWGDYDVDGVTSVTVLLKYIISLGGNCDYYIPKRDDDGYGLNDRVINEYIKNGTKLIITVDSGITAINEINNAIALGAKVIVTDHHECRDILPNASAVINPKRQDCAYPFKELAGVGVVFKFICAVEMLFFHCTHMEAVKKLLNEYSEFVAIGTIADVMPLCSENRIIVSRGLPATEKTKNLGLMALAEDAGVFSSIAKKKKVSSATIGFVLAPRINAAGRMESSKIAVDLFMTESRETAAQLAIRLGEINKNRQALESETLQSALKKIETQCDINNDKVLVLHDDNWHHGIIGIVSSRITEKYNRPSILISFKSEGNNEEKDIGKGSARSIKGMNLVKALAQHSDLLKKFGGHELAAGLSIKRENLQEFKSRINEFADKSFNEINLKKTLDIDCELLIKDLNIQLAYEINKLEPFGISNSIPLFAIKDMRICSIIPIGEAKHTKLILEKNGQKNTALFFGVSPDMLNFLEGDRIDVAFNIDVNNFKNQQNAQMIVRDIRPAKEERHSIQLGINKYFDLLNNDVMSVSEADIPTRTDFAQLYTTIKELFSHNNSNESFRLYLPYLLKISAMRYGKEIPLHKAMFIIDVLNETHLIEVESEENEITKIIKLPLAKYTSGKVILENAPTIKKLFSKLKTNERNT